MKIHMEAVTLLSVLFATATTSSVLATDDRRLGPKNKRMKKGKQTDAPTTPGPISRTFNLRVLLDGFPTVVAASTVEPPSFMDETRSFPGTVAITSGRVFPRELLPIDGAGIPIGDIPTDTDGTVMYTSLCTIIKGTFPKAIEMNNCEFSLCFDAELIGGCTYYKSGGNFPFTIGEPLPPTTATKTGGTGVLGFDSGASFLSIISAGVDKAFVIDLDLTRILPIENIERNVMLANTVPGKFPSHIVRTHLFPSSIQHNFKFSRFFSVLLLYLFIFSPSFPTI
jgi:hypothetical protein